MNKTLLENYLDKHRKMWNWIADETLKRKCPVGKSDYIKKNNIGTKPANLCYMCEYTKRVNGFKDCSLCPLKWSDRHVIMYTDECVASITPFWLFMYTTSLCHSGPKSDMYKEVANYARQIAELPLKPEIEKEMKK